MAKYEFIIQGKKYTSKNSLLEKCRNIRDKYGNREFLDLTDTAFINECINRFCPSDKDHLINNIANIFVDDAPQKSDNDFRNAKNTRCFYATRKDDGLIDDFGLFNWIKDYGLDTRFRDICKACRDATKRTIVHKIENIKFPIRSEYPNSKIIIQTRDDAQVDHYNKDFIDVVNEWVENNGGVDKVINWIKPTESNSAVTEFIETTIKEDFDSFCSKNSHLRIISVKENLSRIKSHRK